MENFGRFLRKFARFLRKFCRIFENLWKIFIKTVSVCKHFLQNFLKNPYKALRGPSKNFPNLSKSSSLSLQKKVFSSWSLLNILPLSEPLSTPIKIHYLRINIHDLLLRNISKSQIPQKVPLNPSKVSLTKLQSLLQSNSSHCIF